MLSKTPVACFQSLYPREMKVSSALPLLGRAAASLRMDYSSQLYFSDQLLDEVIRNLQKTAPPVAREGRRTLILISCCEEVA